MNENTGDTAPAKIISRKGALKDCYCRDFEVGFTTDGEDGDEPDVTIETTGCQRQTNRMFAQGHDAKLVSFLVKAELEGKEVRYGRTGGTLVTSDAISACGMISRALAEKAQSALNKGEEKLIARQAKSETKARLAAEKANKGKGKAKPPREVPVEVVDEHAYRVAALTDLDIPQAPEVQDSPEFAQPVISQIKVGRWTYGATLNADGSATYAKASGEEVTVPEGKWSIA